MKFNNTQPNSLLTCCTARIIKFSPVKEAAQSICIIQEGGKMDLYDKKHTCSLCKNEFTHKRVRFSRIRIKQVDTDFCTHYHGENPSYYSVIVCPFCGFTFTEVTSKIKIQEKETILNFLKDNRLEDDFTGPRNHQLALKAFQRAIKLGESRGERNQVMGNLCLHTAWIYRFMGDEEQEKQYLEKGLDYFLRFYELDSQSGSLAKVLYIIGELYRRLGNNTKAVFWFGRIINDKSINDAGIIRKAREQWQFIKGYE